MPGPGSGRYTDYVRPASDKNKMLTKLYNSKAAGDKGAIYGKVDEADNTVAASVVSKLGSQKLSEGVGDSSMFPTGVKMNFTSGAPDFDDVAWKSAGDPANAFVPDITSPGASADGSLNVDPSAKNVDPKISVTDVKPLYVPVPGTTSPSDTSAAIGASPIGKPLTLGKSSV